MRQFIELVDRFRRDERGVFGIIFALLAIVLIAMSGAVVDFTSVQQARTKAQVALDSAALALQPTIYNSGVTAATIKPQAQALLVDRLKDPSWTWAACGGTTIPCVTVNNPTIDVTAGTLTLTATMQVPMAFVSLVGIPSMQVQIQSVATRQKLNLEVAMVLDNSGSMTTSFGSGTRMSTLQASAKCAVNILFYGVTTCGASTTGLPELQNVRMALVPFNDEVNIGASYAQGKFWLDRTGGDNTFDNDNFDNDDNPATPYIKPTDRIALFNQISYNGSSVSWGGCVEARINNGGGEQYDTDDTTPVAGNTDTLFVPLFAPDEPDSPSRTYDNNYISDAPQACAYVSGTCSIATTKLSAQPQTIVTKTVKTVTNSHGQVTSGPTTTTSTSTGPATITSTSNTFVSTAGVTTTNSTCTCAGETITSDTTSPGPSQNYTTVQGPTTTTSTSRGSTTTTVVTISTTETGPETIETQQCLNHYQPTGLSSRVLQERLCKYTGAVMTSKPKIGFGPNADCPATAIQPLTNSPTTITAAVNAMVANGNTNVQEGTAWGFRVLSPTEPFTEGLPYDQATSKVMIVMTDGENTYSSSGNMNGASLYAAYAYPYNSYDRDTRGSTAPNRGRMGDVGWSDSQFEDEINSRLATTCQNAKNAGITVYTIGLATNQTSDPTGNHNLLTNCATNSGDAYFPTTATDLQNAFRNIANQLAALRLAK